MNAAAVAGVSDPQLRALLHDHWEGMLARYPEWATRLGDRRFDHRLTDRSRAGQQAWDEHVRGWLARGRSLDPADDEDRVTLALLVEQLEVELEVSSCRYREWAVSARDNPLTWASWLTGTVPLDGLEGLEARYRTLPATFQAAGADLRTGLADGLVASAESLRRVVAMLDRQLALPLEGWPLVTELPDEVEAAWRARLLAALGELPRAVAAYRDVVRDEVLPEGRTGAAVGVGSLPGGARAYEVAIREHTGLDVSADDLHATGLAELERIHAAFSSLGAELWGLSELSAIFDRLRHDPELRFTSASEIEDKARSALARANAAVPSVFRTLPTTPCVVERVPDFEAPFTTVAYYRQPAADGTRPGAYFVNVYAPETRPRFEAEALAWHEAVPGHHTQIARAQEQGALPAFRRHGGQTAYIEGWALYAEALADELGLYSGPLDQLGRHGFDAWRAARLVVDTGVHAMGWTRLQAEAFLRENTPLAENNLVNEVDRYISWPGQALAYMTGRLWIERLRGEAEAALGARFSLPDFHEVVLGGGAVSLQVLEVRVRRFLAGAA